MTQRAKRRQKRRKQAAKQKQAVGGRPSLKLTFKLPDSAIEGLQRLKASMLQLSEVELRRLELPALSIDWIDPAELKASMAVHPVNWRSQYDAGWHSAAQQEEAMCRVSIGIARTFSLSGESEAREMVERFLDEHSLNIMEGCERLYNLLSGGKILMHHDRYLVIEPMEQTWVIPTGTRRFYSGGRAFITTAEIQIPVQLLSISILASEQEQPRCMVELDVSSRELQLSEARLWYRNIPIIGTVIEDRAEQSLDRFTRTVQLQIPVVEEIREIDNDGSGRRILRVSESEYRRPFPRRMVDTGYLQRTTPLHPNVRSDVSWRLLSDDPKPITRPKPCQNCRNYHGQTYGGNFLVCGMHPYGVEGEECGDWEDG